MTPIEAAKRAGQRREYCRFFIHPKDVVPNDVRAAAEDICCAYFRGLWPLEGEPTETFPLNGVESSDQRQLLKEHLTPNHRVLDGAVFCMNYTAPGDSWLALVGIAVTGGGKFIALGDLTPPRDLKPLQPDGTGRPDDDIAAESPRACVRDPQL